MIHSWRQACRFAALFLLASLLVIPIVSQSTLAYVASATDGINGVEISVTLYLIVGFIALYFIPHIKKDPDKNLQTTWKGIVGDAWRRGIYALCLLMYYTMGVWVYQSAVDIGIEITWLFVMLTDIIEIIMFLWFAYCMIKLIADAWALVAKRIEAERYRRDWRD
jgi:hypothetical protein